MSKQTIMSSDEAWEEGKLGADEAYVKIADPDLTKNIDEAAGTQMISIRLQKALIEDFKIIAEFNNGIGYQTLMKQILQRFVDSEKKQIWNSIVAEKIRQKNETGKKSKPEVKPEEKPAKQRKAA